MNMENITPRGEFLMIMTNLESDNTNANIAGVNRTSTLIAGGMLPEPGLILRLVTGLASYLSKSEHDIALKKVVHSTLLSIRAAINRNNMNMDPSVRSDTLEAIQCCLMDETFRRVQRQGVMVRLGSAREQRTAVKVICMFLRRALVHITDARCVAAFASLMLSPYAIVLYECEISLLSLIPVAPGFIFSVARAYFYEVKRLPPRSSLISNVAGMLDGLENISLTMADREEFTYFAMDVLVALENRNLVVRKKLLNMAVSLITVLNVDDVLLLLRTELDMPASADTPFEYKQMLEKAITEIHSAHPVCIMPFIVEAKYDAYVDCIGYIMDIIVSNPLQRLQFLNGLLRVLPHVKSSVVCAATVWAISVSTVPRKEVCHVLTAISSHFKDMLEQHKIEKQINGELEVQHGFTRYTDHYSARQGEAEGMHQQPWLMDMEELLFVHLGLTRQADGSFAIASSSRSSTDDEDESLFTPSSLEPTDNLARLMLSGDALLTDFVCNVVSRLEKMATED